ncbi:glycosyltransferase family 2 protein [Candidatus Falkowbacteria bacterium]|nr:glycosyltransferase family 2 protein [Candidatus Falkowbacteria bacterium]
MKKKTINKIILLVILYALSLLVFIFGFSQEPRDIQGWEHIRPIMFILFIPLLTKYIIHLLIVPWHNYVNKRVLKNNNKNYQPLVSFIIPAWNEEVGIVNTIKSVLKSDYKKFEIIIVNDGSTDKTGLRVKEFINSYKGAITIKYFKKENGGKSSALNLGIKKAEGEIIITSDADCVLDFKAISNLAKYFSNQEVMASAGNVRVGNNQKIIGAIQKLEYLYGFYFKRSDSILNTVYIVGGAAAAYRKTIFKKLGYFDEEIITEDIEYSTRILNSGYKICYAADAIFYTEVPSDLKSLIKQRLRWKYGRLKTFLKYQNLFFKIKGQHSKFLSFLILPVALFSEILLFFEVILLPVFFVYTFLSGDFIPLIVVVSILSIIIFLQIITDVKWRENKDVIFWAPIAWLVFYFVDFIEYVALVKSIIKIIKNKTVAWQKWERVGVFGA